jgi:hypothetical protein
MKLLRFLPALLLAFLLLPLAPGATVRPESPNQTYALDPVAANNTDLIKVECLDTKQIDLQITGTWTATVSFQASNDDTNYNSILAFPIGTVNGAATTSTTATGAWVIPVTARWIRIRTTSYTSGTTAGVVVTRDRPTDMPTTQVSLGANQSINFVQLNGNTVSTGNGTSGTGVLRVALASDQTTNTNPLLVGGTGATSIGKAEDAAAASGDTGVPVFGVRRDAATASASAAADYSEVTVNRFGALYNTGIRTAMRSYSATGNVTVAASATDVAAIFGNVTTTVQVTKIKVTGIQTTTGTPEVLLIVRSTANSGGSSSNMSVARHEQADSANSSTPITYTANPTPGTSAGTLRRAYLPVGSAASALSGEFIFEARDEIKPIVLSGTAQGLVVNLNGVTVTGGIFNIVIEWVEF